MIVFLEVLVIIFGLGGTPVLCCFPAVQNFWIESHDRGCVLACTPFTSFVPLIFAILQFRTSAISQPWENFFCATDQALVRLMA
jgi:hypothetical protein